MKSTYLEVTYRSGKVLAAYFHLAHEPSAKGVTTVRMEPGLVVDIAANGKPIGIEITAPTLITLPILNDVLRGLGCAPATLADLEPLLAA